jgi:cytochrome c biogenesis protein CcdA
MRSPPCPAAAAADTLAPARVSLEFVLFVAGMGLADSLNPATIAVAVVLAATERPVWRLIGYTAGIFSVYLAGGLLLTLGPSGLIRTATNRPDSALFNVALIVAGLVALGFAVWVFLHRHDRAHVPDVNLRPGSALGLGAGMTAVDLPTAFPYFAVIVAIIGKNISVVYEIVLLVLFNVMYVLPIVVIIVIAAVLGERAAGALKKVQDLVTRWSPILLAVLSAALGAVALVAGIGGLVS